MSSLVIKGMEAEVTESDKLYFPHQWQKRYPVDRVLEEHIKFLNRESYRAVKSMRCEFDVPYGLLAREKYNIFGIDLPDDSPIVIHVHGGYWQVKEINHSNQAYVAKALHKHQIKVIAIGYELCPDVTVRDIMTEIEVALKRCLHYAKRCQSRGIYLYGHSVGAHLVASLFSNFLNEISYEEQKLIKAVFLSCGIYDVTPLTNTIINEGLNLTAETAKLISAQHMTLTSPKHIAFYVIIAEYDSPAFLEQGKNFHRKLEKSNIKSTLHVLKDDDHFSATERIVEDNFEITQLIIQALSVL